MKRQHQMPFGAQVLGEAGVRFRLWAPTAKRVELLLRLGRRQSEIELRRGEHDWYEHLDRSSRAGARYAYRIDSEIAVPDPASRFNPDGVHGSSEVIDPAAFDWTDTDWSGRPWRDAVLYELHLGTLSPQGDFAGAQLRLHDLARLGVTALEVMPVAAFPGKFGWGYDGVLPFAPHAAYGPPDAFKRFVQAAHAHRLMVLLDVVYNHFGPDGNYLHRYARRFFTSRHRTPWGDAIDFATPEVREFFLHNALYWLEEFHLDGLRLDAVHAIRDDTPRHVIEELLERVQQGPGRDRHVHIVLENHDNAAHLLRGAPSAATRRGSASQWNDDFHHALHVLITGERDGYYADFAEQPVALLGRALAGGFAFQGQPSRFDGNRSRGEPSSDLAPGAFVNFLQNHDQVGNRAFGERIGHLAEPQALRAACAVLLLAPSPPLLFMGEEYAAPQPFCYFCDLQGPLADAVTDGRRRELEDFAAFARPEDRERIPPPCDATTFGRSVLIWPERNIGPHRSWLSYTRGLLELRQRHIVPLVPRLVRGKAHFEVIEPRGLKVSWAAVDGSELVLVANFDPRNSFEHRRDTGGELLMSTPPAESGSSRILPWQVRWHLCHSRLNAPDEHQASGNALTERNATNVGGARSA